MAKKVGKTLPVLIDEVDEEGATGRSPADAPEIDGNVFLDGETRLKAGDLVQVKVVEADEYDLWGSVVR
jgi:ribosomal protein S12 methylthiotransferase